MQPRGWLVTVALSAALVACDDEKGDAKPVAGADTKTPEAKTPEAKTPEAKAPEAKAPEAKTAEAKPPEAKTPDAKAPTTEVPAVDASAPKAPTGPVFVDGDIDLSFESVGELHPGMTAAEVVAKFGKPPKTDEIEEEGATGEFVQTWSYPEKGVLVGLTAATKKGPQTVRSLTADASCKLSLSWGLKIGSTRAEVEAIYGSHFDADMTDADTFIAGSIYGGAIYTFEAGKVTNLFLGAGAE